MPRYQSPASSSSLSSSCLQTLKVAVLSQSTPTKTGLFTETVRLTTHGRDGAWNFIWFTGTGRWPP